MTGDAGDVIGRMPEGHRRRFLEGTHPADPRRTGSMVAVVGGIVFVAANSGALPAPWPVVLIALAAVIAAAIVYRFFIRPASLGAPRRPHRFAWGIYLASVVAMIGAIALGRSAAGAAGAEHLNPSIIAFCVGAHFLPFAWAFRERMIVGLAIAVASLGALGVAAGIVLGPPWASLFAVAAGFAQLLIIAVWAWRPREMPRVV